MIPFVDQDNPRRQRLWLAGKEGLYAQRSRQRTAWRDPRYGHGRYLTLKGVGYKAWRGRGRGRVNLELGFTHYVSVALPEGLTASPRKARLFLRGPARRQVSDLSHRLRAVKAPDPYKGKGVRFHQEPLRLKVGKVKK